MGSFDLAKCIYNTLKNEKMILEPKTVFEGYMKSDIFKFFNGKDNLAIIRNDLKTSLINHYDIEDIKMTMDKQYTDEDKAPEIYIYKSLLLFLFFFLSEKRPELYNLDFLADLYDASGKYYDIEDLADVPNAILFVTVTNNKDFVFFKEQLTYWNKNKEKYSSQLMLRCTGDSLRYDEWIQKLNDGAERDIENIQETRASMNIITQNIKYWKGFQLDNKGIVNDIISNDLIKMVLDSNQRRLYYFTKYVNEIIVAQEGCEDDIFAPVCRNGQLVVDRLLEIINNCFDGTREYSDNCWALGNFSNRISYYDTTNIAKRIDPEKLGKDVKKLYDENTKGNPRGKRKYIMAYLCGKYQSENELDKEIIISKELLLMLILILRVYKPDTKSLDDVSKMLYNARYGNNLTDTHFDKMFKDAFDELGNAASGSLKTRVRILKSVSAKYEREILEKGKTMFADAILGKELRDVRKKTNY